MMFGNPESLTRLVFIDEGLQKQTAVPLETFETETFEKKNILSEIDESRVDEAAEIMGEVFSGEILANWSEMSLDEKSEKLNEYYIKAGESLGIDTKGVIVEEMHSQDGIIKCGYNLLDGYIHINSELVNDPSELGELLDTVVHEMRHQLQKDAVVHPESFGNIPNDVLAAWEYELNPSNYINADYDLESYMNQSIECDARNFAENVLESYQEKLRLI